MEAIIALAKRRGFVFPGSEIYGGFAGTYDWGPLGVLLRKHVADSWIAAMSAHDNIALLDSSIITAPEVWVASGHVSGFNDPLVVCLECHSKLRADHLLESAGVNADEKMSELRLNELFDTVREKVACPMCGKRNFGKVVQKNLMATTTLGQFSVEDKEVYLRAETAQGIYINYKNVLNTGMYHVPFGIAQVGKVFRNEISPRQFLFRKREFEQMEMQYFIHPDEALTRYNEWKEERLRYYASIGIKPEHLRFKRHDNLVFYAKDAWDIEYQYPFGWGELEGLHYRGDYDLSQHQKHSGVDMSFFDDETHQRYIPHVIETSAGLDRSIFAVLADAYDTDTMNGETRTVLRLHPNIAPYRAAVFPLLKNKPQLVEKAREVYRMLKKQYSNVVFDDNGNIGKRYRRQDEIGTPYCVTIDFDTLGEKPELKDTVTLRNRDTGEQERVVISELISKIA